MVTSIRTSLDAAVPTWAHAVEAFLATHSRAQAWSPGTVAKYHQTLTGLAAGLAGSPAGRSVAALDTPAAAVTLQTAFTTAYGALAPATRADSTSPRCARRWRGGARWAGWPGTRPPAGPDPRSAAITAGR